MQIWRAGRQASRQELKGAPRPTHDGIHLLATALAVVLGLVLLIFWMSRPISILNVSRDGALVSVCAFLIFVYFVFVIGIRSSHHASGDKANPWLAGLWLLMAAALICGTMLLPMVPNFKIPQQYQTLFSVVLGIAALIVWPFLVQRLKGRTVIQRQS